MENSFGRHTEDYCVVILCCNCILSPYALITRFLKCKKNMEVTGYCRMILRHAITCKVCYSCFYRLLTMSLTILNLSLVWGSLRLAPITQWYCSYNIVLSFDVWLHCDRTNTYCTSLICLIIIDLLLFSNNWS